MYLERVLARAEAAGATTLVRARDAFWGGRYEITERGEHLMKRSA